MPSIKKFDICVARPKGNPNDGVWWHRIGTASENDRGQISLFFNSLPFADKDGRCGAMLFEQKEFSVDIKPMQDEAEFPFSLHATKSMRLILPDMQALSARMTALAAEFRGRYDGWAA